MLSKRSRYAENPIEEEDKLADKLEKKGMKIIRLNRGDPPKYFPTPKYIVDAYIKALKEGKTTYSSAEGIYPLRDAVAKRYKRVYGLDCDANDVIVTAGVSEALSFLNSALVNDLESGIIFRPYYPLYVPQMRLSGGIPLIEDYDEKSNWNIDTDKLNKSLKAARSSGKINRIKYMLITNPNNPTGTVLNRQTLKEVADIANEYKILLISDEIYDEIVYNRAKFTSMAQIAKGIPCVILNGASKVFDSTGFRIGFMLIPGNDKRSEELRKTLYNYALMRLSVNVPAQYAATEAINNISAHKNAINSMVKEIERRANHATNLLEQNKYLSTIRPNGAFYILPKINLKEMRIKNDKQFTDLLLEKKGIQVTRGSGFGASSHFRIVALPPKEILDYAINRINTFCKEHAK